LAAGVGVGDEVIVPAFTVFPRRRSAARQRNPDHPPTSIPTRDHQRRDIRRRITPHTKPLFPFRSRSSPDMDPILDWPGSNNLTVIETTRSAFWILQGRWWLDGAFASLASRPRNT